MVRECPDFLHALRAVRDARDDGRHAVIFEGPRIVAVSDWSGTRSHLTRDAAAMLRVAPPSGPGG